MSEPDTAGATEPSEQRSARGGRRSRARTPGSELPPDEARRKAKEICFDLLAARPRTNEELRSALARKGFDPDVIGELLRKLDDAGLIDDAAFAETWVRSRHNNQGLAKRALVAELRRKGVDGDVAAEAAGEIDASAEEDRARELVRKKLRTMTGVDEQKATRRLLGMLARKGYPQGLSYAVVRDELRSAGAESTPLDDATAD